MTINDLRNKIDSIENMVCTKYSKLYGIYSEKDYVINIYSVKGGKIYTAYILYQIPVNKFQFGETKDKKFFIPITDYLLRELYVLTSTYNVEKNGGSGVKGRIDIYLPDQRVLERNVIRYKEDYIEFMIKVQLPEKHEGQKQGKILSLNQKLYNDLQKQNHAKSRNGLVDSKLATRLLCNDLPRIMNNMIEGLDYDDLLNQIQLYHDQETIRGYLKQNKFCAFIGNGSTLPRKGETDYVEKRNLVKFYSPDSLLLKIPLRDNRLVEGMGIKEGVTLIVGEGYHGKSTILNAIEQGVYNHVSGDGREYVITDNSAVRICAEDGRSIQEVNLSAFIHNLPNRLDTRRFSTKTASGSTSQAAAVIEALQAKSKLLLFDEDRSANNFITKDTCMQRIIEHETITPYIDRAKEIYQKLNTSSIMVMGGSSDYIDIADTILLLQNYHIKDITNEAKNIFNDTYIQKRKIKVPLHSWNYVNRLIQYNSNLKIEAAPGYTIRINNESINLKDFLTMASYGQVNLALLMLKQLFNPLNKNWGDVVNSVEKLYIDIDKNGLQAVEYNFDGEALELPRPIEVINIINHIRAIQIKAKV